MHAKGPEQVAIFVFSLTAFTLQLAEKKQHTVEECAVVTPRVGCLASCVSKQMLDKVTLHGSLHC